MYQKAEHVINISRARQILGTVATDMSDETIERMMINCEAISDIILKHIPDSKIQSCIDNPVRVEDNKR